MYEISQSQNGQKQGNSDSCVAYETGHVTLSKQKFHQFRLESGACWLLHSIRAPSCAMQIPSCARHEGAE